MKWKHYRLGYCRLCQTIYHVCESCKNSSCNGGGCDKCMKDWEEWQVWVKTPEAIKKEKLLKFVAFWRYVWYALFKWDKDSRLMKSIFGMWGQR